MDRRLLRPSGPAPCQTMTLLACSLVPSACHAPWRPTGEATPPAQGSRVLSHIKLQPNAVRRDAEPTRRLLHQAVSVPSDCRPAYFCARRSILASPGDPHPRPRPPSLPPPNFSVASPASSLHPQLSTSREWSYAVHGEKWFLTTAATSPHNTNDINRLIIRPPWMAGAPQWASSASSRGNTGPGAGLAP